MKSNQKVLEMVGNKATTDNLHSMCFAIAQSDDHVLILT